MHFLGHNVKLLLVLTLNKQCEEYSSGVLKSGIGVLLHLGGREELGSMEVCIAFVPPQDLFCYCHFSRQFLCQLGFLCCYTFSSTWDRDFVYFLSRVFVQYPHSQRPGTKIQRPGFLHLNRYSLRISRQRRRGKKYMKSFASLLDAFSAFRKTTASLSGGVSASWRIDVNSIIVLC